MPPTIQSVSEFARSVRDLLEESYPEVWIQGEISNLAAPPSGHMYFSLKDEKAQVRCALFRNDRIRLREQPIEGAAVILRGKVSLYAARGDFQVIVDYVEPAGEGELRRRFEQLKTKLERQGLFDPIHKRPIPEIPITVGIITSASGAALRDILSTLQRRFPVTDVILFPVSVQGSSAVDDIVRAFRRVAQGPVCDSVILARGGGSLEDLWAFNEEAVVRAIRRCPSPVVTGVGHETDVTLADFAADIRAATPTAAAEAVSPDCGELLAEVGQFRSRARLAVQRALREHSQQLDVSTGRLQHPLERIASRWQFLLNRQTRLSSHLVAAIHRAERNLNQAVQALQLSSPTRRIMASKMQHADLADRIIRLGVKLTVRPNEKVMAELDRLRLLNPINTLGRGYAIVRDAQDGSILTRASTVAAGDSIEAQLHHGWLKGTVVETGGDPATQKDKA